ncbi:MAG: Lipopolysaccharide core biosynthesis glycosyltransferase [uncultured bacterium]|nr:MAG: Lipopolysaccharide core biosynthesis glycosyltransferase [uncultured bacterium]OGT32991.1 MAG: hypothetical protein A3C44_06570 [Gammaproteobacteria bacterium RIFCSPHIGHO2_02_FULL_39_13]OGT49768.1 MAG: hypothetical protein A3E53_04705 [Gammaproteobacteria bacterium RIFCSPHIGHO2_12_FULL_39_24]
MKPSLSVILITKNNEKTIEKCLESVKWADEIVVLDSGSTDRTLSLCTKYTTKIIQTDWPGFGPQKNRAIDKATGDWIFSIDSDEWLSDASRDEIIATINNPTATVFQMPRLNQYCGQWIRHGDVGKDKVIRLFKRGAARFNDNLVHEKLQTDIHIGILKNSLLHNSYDSLDALLQRINYYTTLSAQSRFKQNKKTNFAKAIFSAWWAFTKSYFFRAGFLDGKMGFIVSLSSAESSFYRHVKLMELQKHAR